MAAHHHELVLAAGLVGWLVVFGLARWRRNKRLTRPSSAHTHGPAQGFAGLIGNTPMLELRSLSRATGCTVLAKAEFMNPGGSTKDRVAKSIVEHAEAAGLVGPGRACTIVEGTSGSTGISLAFMARSRGYACEIVLPDDVAQEKAQILRQSGAVVHEVRPASISNRGHYCNVAAARARELHPNAVYANQFETPANFDAHYRHTGPEIWSQTGGRLDAFVMSAGTGGTIAGVSRFLKDRAPHVRVVLADVPGSSLANYVTHGVCYAPQQAERRVRRHRYDTIAEGVGLDRLTANFRKARVDGARRVSDRAAVEMAHYMLREEGLFLGSSNMDPYVVTAKIVQTTCEIEGKF
eukprot:g4085.t1